MSLGGLQPCPAATVPDQWGSSWLAAAVATADETVLVTDLDATIVYVNPSFERVTGYSAAEAVGQNPRMLASGKHDEAFYRDLWQKLTSGQPWRGHLVNRRKDGSLYEEQAVILPVRDEAGVIICYVAVKRDFSEECKLREDLAHARKVESLGRLAAGIAHQINTPLQYLLDNLRFLEEAFGKLLEIANGVVALAGRNSGGEMDDLLSSVDLDFLASEGPGAFKQSFRGLEKVAEVIRAMGQFSHPGGEGFVAVDLNAAILSTLSVCRNEWCHIAEVETDLDDSLPRVVCRPRDINHVILALVLNAADAIREALGDRGADRGALGVSTRLDGDCAEVRVSDDGMGIPASSRAHVFEPFFSTKKEVSASMGQGLAVAKRTVVETHGGEISFETEEGKGTTFIIRLPIEPRTDAAGAGAAQCTSQSGEKTDV